MPLAATTAAPAEPVQDGVEVAGLTRARLSELDRLRDVAFLQIGKLADACEALPKEQVFAALLGGSGQVMEFERLTRAIRQIMVLEFELRGLFKAPDRDAPRKPRLVKSDRPGFVAPDIETLRINFDGLDGLELPDLLDIRSDYRTGPLDQVVAGIRRTIGAEPPEDDPFAPPPGRQETPPTKLPPATVKLPEKQPAPDPLPDQRKASMKAALIAIRAKGGDGFRKPAKIAKRRPNGRGPPR